MYLKDRMDLITRRAALLVGTVAFLSVAAVGGAKIALFLLRLVGADI